MKALTSVAASSLLFGSLALVALSACGDDGGKKVAADTAPDVIDTAPDGTTPEEVDSAEPETVAPGPSTFAYDGSMVSSSGGVCTTSCAMRRTAGDQVELAVVYKTGTGQPLQDIQIGWDAGDAPTDLAKLNAFSSYTDAQGVAKITVRSGGLVGSATIKAHVSGDATTAPAPLEFVLTYDAPPQPDLAASFQYVGHESFTTFQLRLFKQVNGAPSCAAVHPDAGSSIQPTLTLGPLEQDQQARIATLPGLATEGTQHYAVQFIGPHIDTSSGTGPRVALAVGCNDNVTATAGQTATALVYVLDLPKHFSGAFQTTTRVDTLSGGEGTVIGNILLTLSEIFTRPGHLLVVWACGNDPQGTLGTVCGWITNSSGEPNLLGGIITDAADAALLALFAAAVGDDIQDASQLISEMLRDLRLIATVTYRAEPSTSKQGFDGALFAPGDAHEEWTHVRFRWKFDPTCKNSTTPDDCGWASIPLEDIYGSRPTADPEVGIDQGLAMHVTPHAVPLLTYGPLINYIIEHRILPLVFASGGDEPLDSWDDFVATLFGDRKCLDYDDCCEYFSSRLDDSAIAEFVDPDTRALACEIAIPLVAQLIRSQIQNLDGALNLGTPDDQPCPAVDTDSDRYIDAYGTQATPCHWNLWFPVGGSDFTPDNDWQSIAQ